MLCCFVAFCCRPLYYVLADECDSQIIVYKNGADPDFRRKHLDMNPERWMGKSFH